MVTKIKPRNHYKAGDWNAVCDICGWTYHASELMLNYRGLRVCRRDFETRNPQEFIKQQINVKPSWFKPKPFSTGAEHTTYNMPGLGVFLEEEDSSNYNIPGHGVFVGVN